MFTGIIEASGILLKFSQKKGTQKVSRMELKVPALMTRGLKIGSSVAVNGVCLTAVKKTPKTLFFEVVEETKKRSALGQLTVGDAVNLERPMKLNARVHGHFVLGHVDGLGKVQKVIAKGRQKSFLIAFPKSLKKLIHEKGSIAIDGISLTVGKVSADAFWTHLIPHTLKHTNTGKYQIGTKVNLEADILSKIALQ